MQAQLDSVILVGPFQLRVFCDSLKPMESRIMRNLGISGFGTNEQANEEHSCEV